MKKKKLLSKILKCKLVFYLVLAILIASLPNFVIVSANTNDETSSETCASNTNDVNEDIHVVDIIKEDGKIITIFNDGTSSIAYEDGMVELHIPTTASFIKDEAQALLQGGPSVIQARGFFAIVVVFAKIVSGVGQLVM
ncbi:MAG: hypothetical protein ACK5KR_00910 [Breznakia sp.]